MEPKTIMYKQGNGWVVSSWSNDVGCYRVSHEMPYTQARAIVSIENCQRKNCCIKNHKEYHARFMIL